MASNPQSLALVGTLVVLLLPSVIAQTPAPGPSLDAAIIQLRDGAFYDVLLTLNDVVEQLAGPEHTVARARAHAYRALVYLRLEQPERARTAVLEALKTDGTIALDPTEFGMTLVTLFMQARENPQAFAAAASAPPPPAPPAVAANPSPPPFARPATIYIYWPKQVQAGLGRHQVMCDRQHVADLQEERHLIVKASPGTHRIAFRNREISENFEGGREYYIRASFIYRGPLPRQAQLRLADASEAASELREKASKLVDAERTYGTECLTSNVSGAGK